LPYVFVAKGHTAIFAPAKLALFFQIRLRSTLHAELSTKQIGFVFSDSYSQHSERRTLNDTIGFVFSNCVIVTKPLRHKGAKILMSMLGPKGRGNLLRHKQKALIPFDFGFVWL
jgi:hypothetical protein